VILSSEFPNFFSPCATARTLERYDRDLNGDVTFIGADIKDVETDSRDRDFTLAIF